MVNLKVITPTGISTAKETRAYGGFQTGNVNQVWIEFIDDGHISRQSFSKKTGLPYMNKEMKSQGYKLIIKDNLT